jgi:hypothetical protein
VLAFALVRGRDFVSSADGQEPETTPHGEPLHVAAG